MFAVAKISEQQHWSHYVEPFLRSTFLVNSKPYKCRTNLAVPGTRKRPDFSCVVDGITILNGECKPLGYSILSKRKDYVKVQLRAKRSINNQLSRKGGPGRAVFFTNMGMYI